MNQAFPDVMAQTNGLSLGELRDLPRMRSKFDELFYGDFYFNGQPPANVDLFAHYLANVRERRLDPSPEFSEAYYLSENADVAEGVNDGRFFCGFHHFVVCGWHEERAPRPYAAPTWDSAEHPSVEPPAEVIEVAPPADVVALTQPPAPVAEPEAMESSISPELAYEIKMISESGLFDAVWYRDSYGQTDLPDDVLLQEFYVQGHLDGRRPNAYFDPLWYLQTNVDVAMAKVHPLLHYVSRGDAEGRRPVPFFDPNWYRATYMPNQDGLALGHFLQRRLSGEASPTSHFDPDFYFKRYPDVAEAKIDPFLHYLYSGYREGRDPHPEFDTKYYVAKHLKQAWDVNPILHYIEIGARAGLNTAPAIDETSSARELQKATKPSAYFEEFAPNPAAALSDVKVLAYYLPQFHPFAENNEWWGKGFTEWTNVGRGSPRFVGHFQPRIPRDLGFYNLMDPEVIRQQIELARGAGVFGFCFYHYWFNGKRLMQGPVENFLADRSLDMPFCLMWANENWTRRWDGAESEVLIAQDYEAGDDETLIADLARHMSDPRYIRIQGRPVLMLYRPGIIPEPQTIFARWREIFARNHGEHPIIIMAQGFGDHDPTVYGLDGAIEFPPHKVVNGASLINTSLEYLDYEFTAQVYDYDEVAKVSLAEPAPSFPLIKTVVPSWDNDARRQGHGLVITGSTPPKYEAWLRGAAQFARANPFFGEAIVCVNAWNEWCEGAYLEPDLRFGSAYLNATSRALAQPAVIGKLKLLLVGHDAFPSGAQHLLLSLGRLYRDRFGVEVAFVLLGDGKMVEQYRQVARVDIAATPAALAAVIAARQEEGYRHAVINTSASSRAVPPLAAAGFTTVQLIHEAARIMVQKGLVEDTRAATRAADALVFSSQYLADKFDETVGLDKARQVIIQPQGLYQAVTANPEARQRIRAELGLGKTDVLVFNAGYADLRKGFDIFLQMWRAAQASDSGAHFLWAGDLDPELDAWMRPEIDDALASGTFHHIKFTKQVADYFAACDVFALTSREDPYPSVVLEAISCDKPVVAFTGGGGIPELITPAIGETAPYGDALELLAAAMRCASRRPSKTITRQRQALIEQRFDFGEYGWKLLDYLGAAPPKCSVIVPNYNYQRYLGERLGSIFDQDSPVYEIIVLDDASPDDSLAELAAIGRRTGRAFALHPNQVNSGSVFEQWRRGIALAKGELVWIAEADDACEPSFLSRLTAPFADPDVAFVFCDSTAMDTDGVPIWPSYKEYYATVAPGLLAHDLILPGPEFLARHLAVKNLILNVSSVVWRKSALVAAMEVAEAELSSFAMAGDWLIYARACLLAEAKVGYISEPLNHHRRHASSVTHALKAERHLEEIRRMHGILAGELSSKNEIEIQQSGYLYLISGQLNKNESNIN